MRRLRVGNLVVPLAIIGLIVAIVLIVTTATHSDRTYTFTDDFTGSAGAGPNLSKWSYDLGGGGWGNNELQEYTNSRKNSFLDGNGHLVLRATRHNDTYSSARLTTAGHFSQRYGHWESRLKINSQAGFWPAWWMLGNNFSTVGWPRCGEVDMVEDYGFSAVESSVHTGTSDAQLRSSQGGIGNDTDFHTFRMDWSPREISFSRDGVQYAAHKWTERDGASNPPAPMFMLLNLAVGGNVGNPPPDANLPVDFVVDYVRVWS